MSDESVTQWIEQLKEGHDEAATKLWERYSEQIVRVAKSRLSPKVRTIIDEEDVALSVFTCLCNGAAAGRFQDLANRDELWWLLLLLTKRKVATRVRKENSRKRGGGKTRVESDLHSPGDASRRFRLDDLVGDEPTPEFATALKDQHRFLLELLRDDTLRFVATARIEGYTPLEIAGRLGVSESAVHRKLRLIRNRWRQELEPC